MQLGPPAQHLATGTARLGFLLQSRRLACPTQLAFAREGYSREQRSLSIQEGDALLASQFHPKNAPLRPEDVRLGSNKDVLWLCKCQKCGHPHEWAASPERRFTLGEDEPSEAVALLLVWSSAVVCHTYRCSSRMFPPLPSEVRLSGYYSETDGMCRQWLPHVRWCQTVQVQLSRYAEA